MSIRSPDAGSFFTGPSAIPKIAAINSVFRAVPQVFCVSLALALGFADAAPSANTEAESPVQLKRGIENAHPAQYYKLAAALFADQSTKQEALFWFYVGQIRYRYHLAANPDLPRDGDPALFASLSEVIGRPINEYAGGKPEVWMAEINRALEWDAAHDNGFTPKSKSPEKHGQIRAGLVSMRDQLKAMKDKLPEMRRQNGIK